jgi:hypothetical protein
MQALDTVTRIVALLSALLAFGKTYFDSVKARKANAQSAPAEGSKAESVDFGLFSLGLLVSAIGAFSLSSALFSRDDLLSWSIQPYIISGVIAIVYAIACVAPITITKDLRHLLPISIAGLLPVAALPLLSLFRLKGGTDLIADGVNSGLLLSAWVFLVAAFMTYWLSAGKNTGRRGSTWVTLNTALIIVCALALGIDEVEDLRADPKARAQVTGDALNLEASVEQLPKTDQLTFYQFASEIALSPYYLQNQANEAEPEDTASDSSEANSEDFLQTLRRGMGQHRLRGVPAVAKKFLLSLPQKELANLLAIRLSRVHPVPESGKAKFDVEIPGITAKDRFIFFNNLAIGDANIEHPNIKEIYPPSLYPAPIQKAIEASNNPPPPPSNATLIDMQALRKVTKSRIEQKPKTNLPPYSEEAAVLLALPPDSGLPVITSLYRNLALQGHTRASVANVKRPIQPIVDEFLKLSREKQQALSEFVLKDASGKHLLLLSVIARHANEDAIKKLAADPASAKPVASLLDEFRSQGKIEPNEPRRATVESLAKIFTNADQIADLSNFLQQSSVPQVSIGLVFDPEVLAFTLNLTRDYTEDERKASIAIIRDPIGEGVRELAGNLPQSSQAATAGNGGGVRNVLDTFSSNKVQQQDKEDILHNMSMAIYKQDGPNALDWWTERLVDDARRYGNFIAILVASVISIPQVIIVGLLGRVFGRNIMAVTFGSESLLRDSNNALTDQAQPAAEWGLVGRAGLLERLQQLSVRKSGTIGLVGRRGIGKTRILRELLQKYSRMEAIPVWLDCPSAMSQEDFVQSISERLVDVLEKRFARFADIPNYGRRMLDKKVVRSLSCCLGILVVAYGFAVASLKEQTPAIVLASFLLAALGCCIFLVRISTSVASSRGLQRSLASKSAVFEWKLGYDAIVRMTERLRARRSNPGQNDRTRRWLSTPATIAVTFLVTTALLVIAVLSNDTVQFLAVFIALGSVAGLIYYVYRVVMADDPVTEHDGSVVSFTYIFRQFVLEISQRIRGGALGPTAAANSTILVVFIDELDKIVDREELKNFIRVIKSVFDIEGTRFFLSISQDAYRDLVLGSALGKNEFDSSFDHIELIGPMDFKTARELAKSYLVAVKSAIVPDDVLDMVAVLGKGVPRDILRRCDTVKLLTEQGVSDISDKLLQSEKEELCFGIQYLVGLDTGLTALLNNPAPQRDGIVRWVESSRDDKVNRVVLESFIYSTLLTERKNRQGLAQKYYEVLYNLPILTIDSIKSSLMQDGGLQATPATA